MKTTGSLSARTRTLRFPPWFGLAGGAALLLLGLLLSVAACGSNKMPSAHPAGAKSGRGLAPDLSSTHTLNKTGISVGVGRADITPPPGASLAGHGPGGRVAIGHWTRLQCRAFYIDPDDRAQAPLALVSCELPQMSTLLVRQTVEELRRRLRSGAAGAESEGALSEESRARLLELNATRLMIAATHTHAGPGHFFDSKNMGGFASSHFPGFDEKMARFLAQKVAAALIEAAGAAEPAEFREVRSNVWSFSRNSAMKQFRRNVTDPSLPLCLDEELCGELLPDERAIDPTLRLLEFRRSEGAKSWIGVLAFYALHPTFIGNQNRHFGGDIFGVASRWMEQELRREACFEIAKGSAGESSTMRAGGAAALGAGGAFSSALGEAEETAGGGATAHDSEHELEASCEGLEPAFAFFNTNEADAQPRRVGGTRQEVMQNGEAFARAIFQTHCLPEQSPDSSQLCRLLVQDGAVQGAERGDQIVVDGDEPQGWTDEIHLSSAYVELKLPGASLRDPFLDEAALSELSPERRARKVEEHTAHLTKVGSMGLASMRGSQSNPSAMLFLTPTTIEVASWEREGDAALKKPKRSIPGSGGAAETVPLALVQVGQAWLSFIPAEITLTVGLQINRQVGRMLKTSQFQAAEPEGVDSDKFSQPDPFIVGLANGYISYLTTEEEYELQDYHGGSTLYGRESADYFTYAFGCLAHHLRTYDGSSSHAPGYVPPRCGPHLLGEARAFPYKTGPQRKRLWRPRQDRSVRACALEGQGRETFPTAPCSYDAARCAEEAQECASTDALESAACAAASRKVACRLEQAVCRIPTGGQYRSEHSREVNGEGPPPAFCFRWRDRGPHAVLGDENPFEAHPDEGWLVRAVVFSEAQNGEALALFASAPLLPVEAGADERAVRSSALTAIDDRGAAFTTQVLERRRGAWEWSTVFAPTWEQWRSLEQAGEVRLQVRGSPGEGEDASPHSRRTLLSPALTQVAECSAETLSEFCPTGY